MKLQTELRKTGVACMYGHAWHIQMEEKLEKKQDIRHDRVGLQSHTELAKNEKKKSE